MTDQPSNIEKVEDPKHLQLGFYIIEEIGECVIDPSIQNKFKLEYPEEFINYEDFEPFEVEEFEDFEPYCD